MIWAKNTDTIRKVNFGGRVLNINGLDLKNAKTAFLCVGTGATGCKFYAFALENGEYKLRFETDGFIGRGGIYPSCDKYEGDGRTPEGIYEIGECFGNTYPDCDMKVPYTVITDDDYWDGDSESETYNLHVKGSEKSSEWLKRGQYEHLIKYTESYKYAAMINYNVSPAVPGKGSAIFLHVPSKGATSSAGCVVIPEAYMLKALEMIEEGTVIIIQRGKCDI